MARNPAVWYVLYGIVIPLIVLGLSIYFNAGTILVFIGVVLWMGFALTMPPRRPTRAPAASAACPPDSPGHSAPDLKSGAVPPS